MKLVCDKCSSEKIEKFGIVSKLDGKQSYRCLACNNTMAPPRSRVMLIFLMTVALGVSLLGLVWAILVVNSIMKHSTELAGSWIQGGIWSGVFLFVGTLVFWALFKAIRQNVPKRIE